MFSGQSPNGILSQGCAAGVWSTDGGSRGAAQCSFWCLQLSRGPAAAVHAASLPQHAGRAEPDGRDTSAAGWRTAGARLDGAHRA